MKTPLIEGCVDSHASALAAFQGGADRLELCANLAIGGTTPSRALFRQVRRDCAVKINVLIRPRFGDFLYSDAELDEMREEIEAFRDLGANGVVTGVLTPEGEVDERRMRRLADSAGGMDITLHRAFDMTRDPFAALEAAVRLGCRTILTSGQARNALEGAELLGSWFAGRRAGLRSWPAAACGRRTSGPSTSGPESGPSTPPEGALPSTAACSTGSPGFPWVCPPCRNTSCGRPADRNSRRAPAWSTPSAARTDAPWIPGAAPVHFRRARLLVYSHRS